MKKDFIKGALFIVLLIPIIENFTVILEQLTKHFCTWIAVKTYKLEESIQKKEGGEQTFAIGFQAPSALEEEYNEEEDE